MINFTFFRKESGEINIMKAILFMSFMFVMIVSFQSSEAHEEEELEPECFACRCPRNIDYQVML